MALRAIPKVDCAAFFERNGRPAFLIGRSKKQADDFDQFVRELVTLIKGRSAADQRSKSLPNQAAEPTRLERSAQNFSP